jgi:hypothetical protein
MSDYGLRVVEVKDNVVALENLDHREYGVYNSGSQVNYVNFKTQGSSNTSITVVCNPPNRTTIIDPKVWLTTQFTIVFKNSTGLTPPANWFNSYYKITDGIRAFPLLQITNTATVNLNGYAVSTNLSEYLNTILRYNNNYGSLDSLYSMCPSMLDQYQSYYFNNNTRFAIGSYDDVNVQTPRGSWAIDSIAYSNSQTGAVNDVCTVQFSTIEPLWVSPFFYNNTGLSDISTMTINLVFNNLNRIWCQSTAPNLSAMVIQNVSVGVVQANFKYYTPKLTDIIPRTLQYNYNTIQTISTSFACPNYGKTAVMSLNAVNLQAVPQRIYIVCRRATNNLDQYSTDTFNYISNISVQWNNRSNLLASAQSQELYQLSRDKGCFISMDQWGYAGYNNNGLIVDWYNGNNFTSYPAAISTGQIGSVICISPSDLGQDSLEANGVMGNPQFALTATIQNINVSPVDVIAKVQLQLTAYIVYEGLFIIKDGQCTSTISPLSQSNVLAAEESKATIIAPRPSDAIDIQETNLGGQASNFLEKIKPYLKSGLDAAKFLGPIIAGKRSSYRVDDRRKKKAGSLLGGKIMGGKKISRKELQENMDELDY